MSKGLNTIREAVLSDPDIALKLVLIVPKDIAEEVTELLLRKGVIEPVELDVATPLAKELEAYLSILERAKEVYSFLEANIEREVVVRVDVPPESIRRTVVSLLRDLEAVYEDVKQINNLISMRTAELEELKAMRRLVEFMVSRSLDARVMLLHYTGRQIAIRTVLSSETVYEQLKRRVYSVIEAVDYEKRIVASLAFSPEVFEELHKNYGEDLRVLDPEADPEEPLSSFIRRLDERISHLNKVIDELRSRKEQVLSSKIRDIAVLKSLIESEFERYRILKSALSSKYVVAITGWVLRSRVEEIARSLTSYPVYLVINEEENPPVEFKNLKPFKPFELLTELYGMPSPHEWDPTPLLTYSFLLFFSMMLADIGYGIGVVLATRYILPKFVVDPESPGFAKLKKILYTCGILSIATGAASKSFLGSLFGRYIPLERPLLNTLSIMELISISLVIGLVFTFMSHGIALAKNLKLSRIHDAAYEIGMLVVIVSGVFVVTRVFKLGWISVSDEFFMLTLAAVLVGIGIVAFTKVKSMGAIGGFLWIFDIVGIVGDVFSYVRIAGIAGGTAFLAEAFNSILVGIVNNLTGVNYVAGMAMGALAVFVIHTLNLALSTVSPFVHSLRLCLFEISSKFFEAQGRKHRPVKVVLGKIIV